MRGLLEETEVTHQFHYLDLPDEVCLRRLCKRNAKGKHAFAATEEQCRRIARHFVPPSPKEGFNVTSCDQNG